MRIIVSTLHLLGQKSAAPLSLAIRWELTSLRGIFFELSTFLVVKDRDSLTIAILLAGYRMILRRRPSRTSAVDWPKENLEDGTDFRNGRY